MANPDCVSPSELGQSILAHVSNVHGNPSAALGFDFVKPAEKLLPDEEALARRRKSAMYCTSVPSGESVVSSSTLP